MTIAANRMLRHARLGLGLSLAVLIAAQPFIATADPAVGIRQGRHGDMGRLVFEFSARETYQSHLDGGTLTIEFTPAEPIGSVTPHIPGVEAMQGGSGIVRLQLAPGATPRIYQLGNRVVVDTSLGTAAMPAAKARPAELPKDAAKRAAPIPAVIPNAAALLPAAGPKPALQAVSPAARMAPAAQIAPTPPVTAAAANDISPVVSTPVVSTPVTSTPVTSGPETIDFATEPGAAAFRRGDQAIIVFDTSEIPDLTALQSSPLFAGATMLSLQNAQVISFALPAADSLALTPVSSGWQVAAVAAAAPASGPPLTAAPAVEFPMQSANQSIVITDPLTGGDLLVGTVMQAGDAAKFGKSGPGFAVLPAWLGVVVVPQADDLALNASLKGFELVSDSPDGLPLGVVPPAPVIAAAAPAISGQIITLPHGGTADLWNRMVADQRAVAILPPLVRIGAQITLAQDMLALGMGPEANGVLDTAVLENPAAQYNTQLTKMRAVANVLAHRSQPGDFTAPGIVPGTETSFWQSLGAVDQGHTGAAAMAGLAAGLELFETYPEALRDRVAAEIAEALADNGQMPAAKLLVDSDPADRGLDLARAKILEDQRQPKAALAAYQALALGEDDRVAGIAEDRAVELRHAAGQLTDAKAADALDAQLFDWRTPQHERHLRLRIAELRADSGQWVQAFGMLQSAHALFPGHREEIDGTRAAMFLKMLKSTSFAKLSPFEAVAVLQQNQDLIPLGNTEVISLLAQRLGSLNLPGTAAPILSHLIQSVPQGTAQARLGATLAQVDLDAGSPVAALADLTQTQADNLPADLAEQRSMLAAKAQAAAGNAIAAVNTLGGIPPAPAGAPQLATAPGLSNPGLSNPALDTQAQIAEQSGQWPQAEQALSALVSQSVPGSGPIDRDQENLLLRLATAASHNNDAAMLASLSSQYGSRVSADAAGQVFQTLTTPALTGDQGLTQALHEIATLQALPAMVDEAAKIPTGSAPAPSANTVH